MLAVEVAEVELIESMEQGSVDETEAAVIGPPKRELSNGAWRR